MGIPRAPEGAKRAGQKLWKAVLSDYTLAEHEMTLLVQACRIADTCDELQSFIEKNGALVAGSSGRVRSAVGELRQQQIALARLVVALRVPIGDQEETPSKTGAPRTQRRGVRGFYAISGGQEGAS